MDVDALAMLDGDIPLELDLDKLIGSHCCVQANSGAGKSGAIRKLLEITHGRVQHIIIDTEDEFYTLREKYEYLIAGGDNGDCAATVNNAAALAITILETGFSAIVQINSLPFEQRCIFIREFLEALTNAPKRLWRPMLVVLDEAQFYAPQKGYASSLEAIVSFMMLGRKRGFTGVLATPRPADLSKQATSPVNNWLIGRCGQPADRRSAADALGFTANSAEARGLRSLVARQFYTFGPALTNEPVLARIEKTATTIVKAGQATLPTPPAPAAMQKILASLNAAAVDKAKADVLADASNEAPKIIMPDPQALEAAETRGFERGFESGIARQMQNVAALRADVDRVFGKFLEFFRQPGANLTEARIRSSPGLMEALRDMPSGKIVSLEPGEPHPRSQIDPMPPGTAIEPPLGGFSPSSLTSAMKETLHAIAWWHRLGHSQPTRKQIGGLLGIISDGSTMRSRMAALSKPGLIEYPSDGTVALTATGKAVAQPVNAGRSIVETVRSQLTATQCATFDAIPPPGRHITREELGAKLGGIDAGGSTMRSRLAELSNRELIEYPKAGLVARQSWVRN